MYNFLLLFVTFLLATTNPSANLPCMPLVSIWATFFGVSSAILVVINAPIRADVPSEIGRHAEYSHDVYAESGSNCNGAEHRIKMRCHQHLLQQSLADKAHPRPDTNWTSACCAPTA